MKSIAVAGKGGTGKSTIAALIMAALVRKGETPVLGIDADADSNLGVLLGIEVGSTVGNLREGIREELTNFPAGMSKAQYVEAGLHDIIEESNGFDLISMGRGEGSGCYCYLNSLIQKFSGDLMPSYKWVVMDNEAGLEHISRRTSTHLDAIILVVTDNPLSLHSAESIIEVTGQIKNPVFNTYAVLNMVKEKRIPEMKEKISALPVKYMCNVPFDPDLEETVYKGESLLKYNSPAVSDSINVILNTIGGNNGNT
jgi:CO dehydrogenase maturation factor